MSAWPFPTFPNPLDQRPIKPIPFNPDNCEDAPF